MTELPRFMPALLTPFTADGSIELAAHERNVARLADAGVTGMLVAGSTGEGPYLEPGERAALLTAARAADPSLFLLCGINAETQRSAAAQITEASDAGADAVLVITPTTLIRNRAELVEAFYLTAAQHSDVPLFLYTVPAVTGYELPVPSVARLAAHPNIAGMKDSGGDVTRLEQLGATLDQGFRVFIGATRAVREGLLAGAHGAITASGNYAWSELRRLVEATLSGESSAAVLQDALTAVSAAVEPMGVAGTKAAAAIAGLEAGHPRLPLRPVEDQALSVASAALSSLRAAAGALTA